MSKFDASARSFENAYKRIGSKLSIAIAPSSSKARFVLPSVRNNGVCMQPKLACLFTRVYSAHAHANEPGRPCQSVNRFRSCLRRRKARPRCCTWSANERGSSHTARARTMRAARLLTARWVGLMSHTRVHVRNFSRTYFVPMHDDVVGLPAPRSYQRESTVGASSFRALIYGKLGKAVWIPECPGFLEVRG